MSETPYNLRGRAGDTLTRYLYHREDDETTAINLTGASVEWGLRSPTTTYQWIDEARASITDAAQGEIKLTLTPTQTRALAAETWSYEVTIEYGDGTRETILDGYLSFAPEVVATVTP